jgi:hypothetical protein
VSSYDFHGFEAYGKHEISTKIFEKIYVKQVNNQHLKMATAKGIRTPWTVLKPVPSHASEALNLYSSIRMQFFSPPSPAGHQSW